MGKFKKGDLIVHKDDRDISKVLDDTNNMYSLRTEKDDRNMGHPICSINNYMQQFVEKEWDFTEETIIDKLLAKYSH